MKWEEFEKAGFLPFIEKLERKRTPWKKRVALWKKIFGTPRSMGSLRGHLSRCILEGSYPTDKIAGSRSSSNNVNTGTLVRPKPVKRPQNTMLCRPQQSPQTEKSHLQRHSVWSVSPNREPSAELSSASTVEGSRSLPSRSPEKPTLGNHGKEPHVPPSEEELNERLKYCFAFCKC